MIPFRTVSGRSLDLERPEPGDLEIGDIAAGLSKCCRFAGQLREFYSVASHSVFVAQLVEPRLAGVALVHDGSEAYIGDLSRALKRHPLLAGYLQIEKGLQDAIYDQFIPFKVTAEDKAHVKLADDLAACVERLVLREDRAFDPRELPRLCAEGYVRSSPRDLYRMADRVGPIAFANPYNAEVEFLKTYLGLLRKDVVR